MTVYSDLNGDSLFKTKNNEVYLCLQAYLEQSMLVLQRSNWAFSNLSDLIFCTLRQTFQMILFKFLCVIKINVNLLTLLTCLLKSIHQFSKKNNS